MMINMLVMVDDFTLENGATYLLSGSHLKDEKPSERNFYDRAERAIGKAGSILMFDSLLWHAAGINRTSAERRALTLAFTRPFQKQQMDYPRVLGYKAMDSFDEDLKQILGYNSRVPTSLDEWYQPPAKRFYRPGQG
jgi:ectoine hydroxylase-related dioxygenase (phytanoyl-CoA dioxygenase family)